MQKTGAKRCVRGGQVAGERADGGKGETEERGVKGEGRQANQTEASKR